MYGRRVVLLLDEARFERVSGLAARRGTSVASVIREAIDRGLPGSGATSKAAAIRRILTAEPMPVPRDPAELKGELDAVRAGEA